MGHKHISMKRASELDILVTEYLQQKTLIHKCCRLMKKYLGCSKVVQWNSTVRRANEKQAKTVERQQGPEKGFVPTTRIQPPAAHAHVDQDEVNVLNLHILSS